MTIEELIALVPLLVVASISVILMLVVSFVRHHRLISLITLAGFIAAGIMVFQSMGQPAIQITPLIILDDFSRFFIVMTCFASVPAVLLAYDYLRRSEDLKEEYYMLLSLAVLGAVVLAASNHFASFFIGVELLSVSLFAMVGYMVHGEHKRVSTLEASIKYMILSGVSSSFLLFGVALIYLNFGVLTFEGIQQKILNGTLNGYGMMGIAMLLIGVGFKLSWVPFHMWTPDVYEGAPVPVTAFLATISKVIVFALGLRFLHESGALGLFNVQAALAFIGVLSMLVGNGLALMQDNLKRLLAYSSIAHFGYLIIALIAASSASATNKALAMEAVGFYLVAYVVTTWVAFGALSALSQPEHGIEAENLKDYRGLFWQRPWLAAIFSVALLSLAGVPLTAGFIAKFYVFAAGASYTLWFLLGILIISSAIGLYYYLKVIMEMCKPAEDENDFQKAAIPFENKLILLVMTAFVLYLGISPQALIESLNSAIKVLM